MQLGRRLFNWPVNFWFKLSIHCLGHFEVLRFLIFEAPKQLISLNGVEQFDWINSSFEHVRLFLTLNRTAKFLWNKKKFIVWWCWWDFTSQKLNKNAIWAHLKQKRLMISPSQKFMHERWKKNESFAMAEKFFLCKISDDYGLKWCDLNMDKSV